MRQGPDDATFTRLPIDGQIARGGEKWETASLYSIKDLKPLSPDVKAIVGADTVLRFDGK